MLFLLLSCCCPHLLSPSPRAYVLLVLHTQLKCHFLLVVTCDSSHCELFVPKDKSQGLQEYLPDAHKSGSPSIPKGVKGLRETDGEQQKQRWGLSHFWLLQPYARKSTHRRHGDSAGLSPAQHFLGAGTGLNNSLVNTEILGQARH